MLGLNRYDPMIAQKMITTAESMHGYKVIESLGPIEGVIEKSFTRMSVAGLGVVEGGELNNMLFDAKQQLAREAHAIGANAVIGCRYAFIGRDLEKSAVAYGTAVKCEKI